MKPTVRFAATTMKPRNSFSMSPVLRGIAIVSPQGALAMGLMVLGTTNQHVATKNQQQTLNLTVHLPAAMI